MKNFGQKTSSEETNWKTQEYMRESYYNGCNESWLWICGLNSSGSELVGSCEYGNEPLGAIQGQKFD